MSDRTTERGRYEDTDAAIEAAGRRSPLSGADVVRLLEESREGRGFLHPDEDDGASGGDAGHLGLSVARGDADDDRMDALRAFLRAGGADDDEGADAARAEHAAGYAEPGDPRPWLRGDVVALGPAAGERPGADADAYLRMRLAWETAAHRHWSVVSREHERPGHALFARLLGAASAAAKAGPDAAEAFVRTCEALALPPRTRFYAEQSEPFRHHLEDRDSVTCLGTAAYPDVIAMAAAWLNGDVGEAQSRRLEVLARLDGVGRAGGYLPDDDASTSQA